MEKAPASEEAGAETQNQGYGLLLSHVAVVGLLIQFLDALIAEELMSLM